MRVEALTSHDVLVEVPVTVTSEHTLGRSFRCAMRGLREAWEGEPNIRLHAAAALGVLAGGVLAHLAAQEWLWVALAISLVICSELVNSSVERLVDLSVGSRVDPLAREAKDLAAGAVLLACLVAVVIGLLIFVPHLVSGWRVSAFAR